jgi:hypothetical protein
LMPDPKPTTEQLLSEILAWTRFQNLERLAKVLQVVLKDTRHLAAYEATDGTRSQADVARVAGLSQPSVSGLWAKWRRLALVIDIDGRPRHLVSPSDIGLGDSGGRVVSDA